jgi:two-component system sensor histidine kinase PilS (NtrC family)
MDLLRRKLKWLMGIRVLIVTLTLGVSIYFQIGKNPHSIPVYYALIGGTALLTAVYGLVINRIRALVPFAYVQLAGDLLIETALVAVTGGVESPFSLLYILSIISASVLLSNNGTLVVASSAGILYGVIVDLQYYRVTYHLFPSLSWLPTTSLAVPEIFYNLSINLLGFVMVGYLSGTLARKLQSAGERLEEKDRDLLGLQEFHRCILESIESGVFTTSSGGLVTSFNRRAEEIMGCTEAEVRDRLWWEVFGWPASISTKALQLSNLPGRIEEMGRRKDGSRLILGMSLSPLHQRGVRTGLVGVFQDLTPLKKMEEEVRRKQWLATIGEMSAGMAHEVRNPLASLSGAIQVLRKDLRPGDANRSLLDLVLRETERLNGIVNGFLQYARPRPLNLKPCHVSEFVDETIRMLEQTPPYDTSIRFVRRLAQKGVTTTMLDPDQMRQVCWNLGLNACQAMPQGGTLTVTTRRAMAPAGTLEGERVEIVFEDTGCGIPEDHLRKIFYPFFTTKEGGTGLGLSVVHRIMDAHEGAVHVDTAPGQGTRVRLLLPIRDHAEVKTP